ncbi:unnamed protein product [Chrysoparadoxa australica]
MRSSRERVNTGQTNRSREETQRSIKSSSVSHKRPLCTSRSTPDLHTARTSRSLGKPGSPATDADPYKSVTQLSFAEGLRAKDHGVPEVDPYAHRELGEMKWINRSRQRLADLAHFKYGGLEQFLHVFDSDGSGTLEFEEFSTGISQSNLEHLFPRSLQRSIYEHMDTDGSGEVDLDELRAFLCPVMDGKQAQLVGPWQQDADKPVEQTVEKDALHDPKLQRIKFKFLNHLGRKVPHASSGIADSRSQALKKQFSLINHNDAGILDETSLYNALGPKGLDLKLTKSEVSDLFSELEKQTTNGKVTYEAFLGFMQVDEGSNVFDPLFDGRRSALAALRAKALKSFPALTSEEEALKNRLHILHLTADPAKAIDIALRSKTSQIHGGNIWSDPIRELSKHPRSLTDGMKETCTTVSHTKNDISNQAFGATLGPFDSSALAADGASASGKVGSSDELFGALAESKKDAALRRVEALVAHTPPATWSHIGHGGEGKDAGVDVNSSFYASSTERFTTTHRNDLAPLVKLSYLEPGKRGPGLAREHPGAAEKEAVARQKLAQTKKLKLRNHVERIALADQHARSLDRVREEARVRAKAKLHLRYLSWVKNQDDWQANDVPRLADFAKRQSPSNYHRQWGGSGIFS